MKTETRERNTFYRFYIIDALEEEIKIPFSISIKLGLKRTFRFKTLLVKLHQRPYYLLSLLNYFLHRTDRPSKLGLRGEKVEQL